MYSFNDLLNQQQPRKKCDQEHQLQVACVNWFRMQYHTHASALFAVPNGGRRDRVSGARLKAEGVLPGVSDLILLLPSRPYHGLLIEMKTDKGKQSPAQKAWQREMESRGYRYIVCHSFEEFITAITNYIIS